MDKQNTGGYTDTPGTSEDVRRQGGKTMGKVQEQTSEAIDQAKQQAKSVVQERKSHTANSIKAMAQTFRDSGQKLREQDEQMMAHYTEQTADRVEQFSNYLQDKNVDEILSDLENFARRQPEVFLGGAVAIGLVAARFLKSSSRHAYRYGGYSQYSQPGSHTTVRAGESAQHFTRTAGWEE